MPKEGSKIIHFIASVTMSVLILKFPRSGTYLDHGHRNGSLQREPGPRANPGERVHGSYMVHSRLTGHKDAPKRCRPEIRSEIKHQLFFPRADYGDNRIPEWPQKYSNTNTQSQMSIS